MSKQNPPQARVVFEGEMRRRFEAVKSYYGLEKNADLIRLLVTQKFEEIKEENPELPRFAHFNIGKDGVRITDNKLERIADLYFKPDCIYCDLDKSTSCEHIDFALTVPKVRRVIMDLNKKEGWKIKLPDEEIG